ncbi:MAG: hypothetical protein CML69_15590 [Rhodobacteraceae bacterium]|nr:hypothetical protein [Paracoccaceae bacterium]
MDFLKEYDARAAAENLIEYELRDQATGKVITNGKKPCVVLIRSTMSEEILSADRAEKNAAMTEAFRRARAAKNEGGEAEASVDFDWSRIEEQINNRAIRLIAGFRNMQTKGDSGPRELTVEDASAFVALNRISEDHHWRRVIPLVKNDGEKERDFVKRKAKVENEWLQASFAQQIVDAASEHAALLGKRVTH